MSKKTVQSVDDIVIRISCLDPETLPQEEAGELVEKARQLFTACQAVDQARRNPTHKSKAETRDHLLAEWASDRL